jgi:hypothetical protein
VDVGVLTAFYPALRCRRSISHRNHGSQALSSTFSTVSTPSCHSTINFAVMRNSVLTQRVAMLVADATGRAREARASIMRFRTLPPVPAGQLKPDPASVANAKAQVAAARDAIVTKLPPRELCDIPVSGELPITKSLKFF